MKDALNRTINVGDKVVASFPYLTPLSKVGTIVKICKCQVAIQFGYYKMCGTPYIRYKNPDTIVVITEQLQHNTQTYPENYV